MRGGKVQLFCSAYICARVCLTFQALGYTMKCLLSSPRSLLFGDTGNIIRSGNSALSKSNGGERDKNVF